MTKSAASGFAGVAVIAAIAVLAVLASAYFVISNRNDKQTDDTATNQSQASQIDADKPLDTAADNSANNIETELDALAEDDYADTGLSDAALYE